MIKYLLAGLAGGLGVILLAKLYPVMAVGFLVDSAVTQDLYGSAKTIFDGVINR